MGPLELTDLIGQDVNLAVGTSVWEQTGRDERYAPTELPARPRRRRAASGARPVAASSRTTTAGRPQGVVPDEELAAGSSAGPVATNPVARTLAMLVNEAVDLVARGEASAEDVDTAMRLGTNYPRGPIEWGAEIGLDVVAAQLAELDAAFPGGRYRPSPRPDATGARRASDHRDRATPDPTYGTAVTRRDLTHVRRMWADDRASAGLGMELVAPRHRPRAGAA